MKINKHPKKTIDYDAEYAKVVGAYSAWCEEVEDTHKNAPTQLPKRQDVEYAKALLQQITETSVFNKITAQASPEDWIALRENVENGGKPEPPKKRRTQKAPKPEKQLVVPDSAIDWDF